MVIAPFLMAFQCDDDIEDTLVPNPYKIKVTPGSSFSTNDTIWISGKVSGNIFDRSVNDSIFNDIPQCDIFSIYKFIEPTNTSNCKDAIDQFELIVDKGRFSFLPQCENAELDIFPELESNDMYYSYRIGLKPIITGDYVVSWQNGIIQNPDRNEFIIARYPLEDHPGQIGFNSCDNVSWRLLNESEKEYYFSIE